MRFRNIFSRDAECPEARYIVIEHQTPELLWQPELMRHDNGARALVEATIVADDPAVAARVEALGGVAKVVASRTFAERFGWSPTVPCLAAITVSFEDLAHAVRVMGERGIVAQQGDGGTWLRPEDTNGFVMRLAQHG